MFEAIVLGIGAGIISSFLTGPVFFSMIKTSIEKGFKVKLKNKFKNKNKRKV